MSLSLPMGGERAELRAMCEASGPARPRRTRPRFVLLRQFLISGFFEVTTRFRKDYLLEQ